MHVARRHRSFRSGGYRLKALEALVLFHGRKKHEYDKGEAARGQRGAGAERTCEHAQVGKARGTADEVQLGRVHEAKRQLLLQLQRVFHLEDEKVGL